MLRGPRPELQGSLPASRSAFHSDAARCAPGRGFAYANFMRAPGTGVVEDALLTMMSHAARHRGLVATLVPEAGGTPAATELGLDVGTGAAPAAEHA